MAAKTAIVTGAARGIGRAFAVRLAEMGFNLVLTYFNSKVKAEELAAELCKKTRVELLRSDVKNSSDCDRTIGRAAAVFPTVDLLVNNAGIAQQKLFTDISDCDWNEMIATNLSGAFYMSRAAVRKMLEVKDGSILNVSSVWGVVGGSMEVHYSAAKAGLIGMTKALSDELSFSNIRVNAVALGAVDTDMIPKEQKELVKQEFGGMLSPDEAAAQSIELALSGKTGEVLKLYDEKIFC